MARRKKAPVQTPDDSVMSPLATGGAGPTFEHNVDAAFLALLLCGGACPFIPHGIVVGVDLQCKYKGWQTDDLLIEADSPQGPTKVVIQVKTDFTLSEKDDDCVKTFQRAYSDYHNATLFNVSRDRVALIIGPTSKKLLSGLRTLLDCARSSKSVDDLTSRLEIPKYLGSTPSSYFKSICAIIELANPKATKNDIWLFLRSFEFASWDLGQSGSIMEPLLRSLLQVTALEAGSSDATWADLLQLAANRNSSAGSFLRAQMPQNLLDRHRSLGESHHVGFLRLFEDSDLVVQNVKTTIGDSIEFSRQELIEQVLHRFEEHRIILLTGPAGMGKSAIAKKIFTAFKSTCLSLAYRAESLAKSHLNEFLLPQGITLAGLNQYFALHSRKFIWIDSLERLLEKVERGAFFDLLRAFQQDPTLMLLLTCRESSTETVKESLLTSMGIPINVISVTFLEDSHLTEASAHFPSISPLLNRQQLVQLLKNPFYLNQAAYLKWSHDDPPPITERDFRAKIWKQRIRADGEQDIPGLSDRREKALIAIARKRAISLEPSIDSNGLPDDALARLKRDSIITSVSGLDHRIAPSHDVFEDWALSHWMDIEWSNCAPDVNRFLAAIGTAPAMRRAYRHWLRELLSMDADAARSIILHLIRINSNAGHWLNDSLLGMLDSPEAGHFIHESAALLSGDTLRLVLQLLRVAGKASFLGSELGIESGTPILLPKGDGWSATVELLSAQIQTFSISDLPLIADFLEDWVSIPPQIVAYPKGAEAACAIIHHFLPQANGYQFRGQNISERFRRILIRIPLINTKALEALIDTELMLRNRPDNGFIHLICNSFYGFVVARDLPNLYLRIAEHVLGMKTPSESLLRSSDPMHYSVGLEESFGISTSLNFEFLPASAYQGPFWTLLRHHPHLGVDLIVRFLNRSCDIYGHPENVLRKIEPPIPLAITDEVEKKIWCNQRLWGMYRNSTGAPSCLESALMALERWLIDLSTQNSDQLTPILENILNASNNVAILAVVSSVVQSAPKVTEKVVLQILSRPEFFEWDFQRMHFDSINKNGMMLRDLVIATKVENIIHVQERESSAQLPHRRKHLEDLARDLQGTVMRDKVHELLDRFKTELPAEDEQSDATRRWRMRLHRMDLRNFQPTGEVVEQGIVLAPSPLPTDIQAMIDRQTPIHEAFMGTTNLLMWGMSVYRNEKAEHYNPQEWRRMLGIVIEQLRTKEEEAQQQDSADASQVDIAEVMRQSGPEYVAVVAVRDHWDELTELQRTFTTRIIMKAVQRNANEFASDQMSGQNPMDGALPAAFILPFLVGKAVQEITSKQLLTSLACAVLHSNRDVCSWAAEGVNRFLWDANTHLAITCFCGLLTFGRKYQTQYEYYRSLSWDQQNADANPDLHLSEFKSAGRTIILANRHLLEADIASINLLTEIDHFTLRHILLMVGGKSDSALAKMIMQKAIEALASMWAEDPDALHQRRNPEYKQNRSFDHLLEKLLSVRIIDHLLSISADEAVLLLSPLLSQVDVNPRRIEPFIKTLVHERDRRPICTSFWPIWQAFTDTYLAAGCHERIASENRDEARLLRALMLSDGWKAGARMWNPLIGEETRVITFFQQLPICEVTFNAFLSFLVNIGASLLPAVLSVLAERLPSNAFTIPISNNARFDLERLLSRLMVSDSRQIRGEQILRNATITLLNAAVASGSSVAFRLRDDFLTPAS